MATLPPQDLKRVYYHIIDDVITKIKPEFVQENVDESVLHTIRQRWAQKLTERGIITEGEHEEVKKEESKDAASLSASNASTSRKRPHDGAGPSGPILKQEPGAGPNPQQPQQHMQQSAPNMLQQQRLPQPAGMTAQQIQQLQQQRMQQPMHSGMPVPQQLTAAPAGVPGMQPRVQGLQQMGVPGLPGGLQGLPAGISLPTGGVPNNLQLGMQGLVRMQQQGLQAGMPNMPAVQGLQGNLAQLQQMISQNPGLLPSLRAQQQQQQQQQHAQLLAQQQLAQQQQQQRIYSNNIPQQDGSSDVPAPLAALAAAAGVDADRLHALVPPHVSSALAAAHARSNRSSSVAATAAVHSSSVSATGTSANTAGGKKPKQQKRRLRRIPQVDGNGDEDDDGAEEEDEGEEFEEEEEVAEEEEAADEEDEDEAELEKLDKEIEEQEEADAENIENVGFALYEKVHRSKNRWRCNLKFGVFFINGKEYMFNKGNTDLTF